MKINNSNTFEKIKQDDLSMMKLALCIDKYTFESYLLIRDVNDEFMIIQDWANDENGVCLLRSIDKEKEILFVGYVENMHVNILKLKK
jgi:hypothetical protein